ncbi:MAG: hypothetical protein V5A39_12220 [Haloarculaceae archaeon]
MDTWTFDDGPLDSGAFGERLARGGVEKVGDEYCLDLQRAPDEYDPAVDE